MAIQVDNRAGSAQLAPLLRSLGVEVELTQMPFGDVSFLGYGANGSPASFGIEVKSIDDCIACIQSGRFAGHQLPGLIQSYDHIWLLVVAEWRCGHGGVLEYMKPGRNGGKYWTQACGGKQTWMWRDVESWLTTMQIMGGLRVHRVDNYQDAAAWIKLVSNWFAREEHKSHQVVYGGKELYADRALLVKPSLARRIAKELPFIGIKRSAEVARVFHTVEEIVAASPRDWMKVEGVGKGIAAKIYMALHQNGNSGGGKK